ncbi:hypothetical protein [Opitutus sp. ER46]|uniref:hypothetical protein n=1 Tax=Opitutus sp. ER46 TaxID=2161864 RepID=UPI0011B2310B|nr:hypothetical protein [Opitutus sp. ER46]
MPKRGRINVAWMAETLLKREGARGVAANAFADREGVGALFYSHTPDGVHSVTRVFVFEERGYICGLIATTSAMSETSAAKWMTDQEPALAAILGSLRLKEAKAES